MRMGWNRTVADPGGFRGIPDTSPQTQHPPTFRKFLQRTGYFDNILRLETPAVMLRIRKCGNLPYRSMSC